MLTNIYIPKFIYKYSGYHNERGIDRINRKQLSEGHSYYNSITAIENIELIHPMFSLYFGFINRPITYC